MLTTPRTSRVFHAWSFCACLAVLMVLNADPCSANTGIESAILVHLQPVSGSCETPITACNQIVRSTSEGGPLEFLIFFMRGTLWPAGEPVCLTSIHAGLSWPQGWEFVAFEPCSGGQGSLDPGGAHEFHLSWSGGVQLAAESFGVVPVARLVMNVNGPGALGVSTDGYSDPARLIHQCWGSEVVSYPVTSYAEAGIRCGYTDPDCGGALWCLPGLDQSELELSAPSGGAATAISGFAMSCRCGDPPPVETHADWCSAVVDSNYGCHWYMHVTADATGLAPGTHQTDISLHAGTSYRCLAVTFTVVEATAAESRSWGRIKAFYR